MNNSFFDDLIFVTASAAVATYPFIGRGQNNLADQAAVNAMRRSLNKIHINGTIVIGEGERDNAPMLYVGEKVGTGNGIATQIALDPLEGTNITANGENGAMTVLTACQKGHLLHAPDVYMEKLIINIPIIPDTISLQSPVQEIIEYISKIKNKPISEITVCILKRDRHQKKIQSVRDIGARIMLINDGDIAAGLQVALGKIDIYLGSGGAPEGVITAAFLQCIKTASMQGKLIFRNQYEKDRAYQCDITNLNKLYHTTDLATGEIYCVLSGVTEGTILPGVTTKDQKIFTTHTWLITSFGLDRYIKTTAPLSYFQNNV